MKSPPSPGESGKYEVVRRLRYGSLKKLFRHRYGYQFTDDDAGRLDLIILLSAASEKMANIIETWATWLPEEERDPLIDHLQMLTLGERMPKAKTPWRTAQPKPRGISQPKDPDHHPGRVGR